MYFFTTVEFYVILAVVAAAILIFAGRPDSVGPVKDILQACSLENGSASAEPVIRMHCLPNGRIEIIRTGVEGICEGGAVSLAIKVKGLDMHIEERLTQGRGALRPGISARGTLPFLKLDRYHVVYNSSSTGLFAAFTFPARIGADVTRPLRQG